MDQEPKYKFEAGQVINRSSGKPIPEDEPVFVLRARDVLALKTLMYYQSHSEDPAHVDSVGRRIIQFNEFRQKNSELIRHPNTDMSSGDWKL